MTETELRQLRPGDAVRHVDLGLGVYLVTGNYGHRVTAVRTVDLTNPSEWVLVRRVPSENGPIGRDQ